MSSAQDLTSGVLTLRHETDPGPGTLPGIEGFFILSADGRLGRYDADGRFSEESEFSDALRDRINSVLRQYRRGDTADIAIGLITHETTERPWQTASLVFSDAALREVFRTGNVPDTPLTAFQKRNRIKSVYQGMELMLDTHKSSQPRSPRFCPVLFRPEEDRKTLCRRYDLDDVDPVKSFEVLDLVGTLASDQRQPALSRMVAAMREARIAPELRRPSGLMLVEETNDREYTRTGPDIPGTTGNPWDLEPETRDTCFNDGDSVSYWLLSRFSPFNELNDLQRQFIARGHTVGKKPAGTTLIERGSREDVTIYLVEGTLELEAFDGRRMTVVGGTRRAHLPISQLLPHAYTVKAATDVTVILFSQVMIREITRITTTYRSRPGIEVTEEDIQLPDHVKELVSGIKQSR